MPFEPYVAKVEKMLGPIWARVRERLGASPAPARDARVGPSAPGPGMATPRGRGEEEELYVGRHRIYLSHYRGSTSSYVVIAPPLFEELARTRKTLINVGRTLAAAGHNVVRFDYRGTGLSHGSFEGFNLSAAAEDLECALDHCRRMGARTIGLLGFRFGAYVVANKLDASIQRAALWEPVLDLPAYAAEMLRIELSNQMITFGKVIASREQLIEKLRKTGSVLIDGYRVSLSLYEQLTQAPPIPLERLQPLNERIKLVFWDNKKLHATASALPLSTTFLSNVQLSWKHIRFLDPRPEPLLAETSAWWGAAS
jgi:alpha/beta superfamily hydrolase